MSDTETTSTSELQDAAAYLERFAISRSDAHRVAALLRAAAFEIQYLRRFAPTEHSDAFPIGKTR